MRIGHGGERFYETADVDYAGVRAVTARIGAELELRRRQEYATRHGCTLWEVPPMGKHSPPWVHPDGLRPPASAAVSAELANLERERRCLVNAVRAPERPRPEAPPLKVNPIGRSVDMRDHDPVTRSRRWQIAAYYVPKLAPEGSRSDNRALLEVVVGDKALDHRYGELECEPLLARIVVSHVA